MPVPSPPAPVSPGRLLRATLVAMVVAAVILVTIVLPAEFGRDPSGVGRALGLLRPAADAAAAESIAVNASEGTTGQGTEAASAVQKRPVPFRSDEMTLTLASGEGAEIKAAMSRGDRFVFSWTATGAGVDVDMHGEPVGEAAGEAASYLKDEWQSSGHGAFEAPFTGNHGWFWQNLNDDPVTVTVKVSGFYQKLFRP